MSDQTGETAFEGWVILELMGRRLRAGYLREQQIGGVSFLRLDVPGPAGDDHVATQLYAASAVYCITPTTEETARRVAPLGRVAPVKPWELPALPQGPDDDTARGWDE